MHKKLTKVGSVFRQKKPKTFELFPNWWNFVKSGPFAFKPKWSGTVNLKWRHHSSSSTSITKWKWHHIRKRRRRQNRTPEMGWVCKPEILSDRKWIYFVFFCIFSSGQRVWGNILRASFWRFLCVPLFLCSSNALQRQHFLLCHITLVAFDYLMHFLGTQKLFKMPFQFLTYF